MGQKTKVEWECKDYLIWIRLGTSGGICMVMNFGFHKMWEIS